MLCNRQDAAVKVLKSQGMHFWTVQKLIGAESELIKQLR